MVVASGALVASDAPDHEAPLPAGVLRDASPPPTTRSAVGDEADRLPPFFWNGNDMRFALLQPRTFVMGSPEDEGGRDDDERQHPVTLTHAFYLQTTEVTNAQYGRYLDLDRWGRDARARRKSLALLGESLGGEDQPAVEVSWHAAVAFAGWLSREDGHFSYHLPTEAEWEYACRAGSTTRFPWGEAEDAGWRFANANDPRTARLLGLHWPGWSRYDGFVASAPVARSVVSAWKLYDMPGNVWEWCADHYGPYPDGPVTDPVGPETGTRRVVRGGSWLFGPRQVRSANRAADRPDARSVNLGFRLVARPLEPRR